MRRAISDGLISVGALLLLLAALMAVDERVRERVTDLVRTPPSSVQVAGAGARVGQISHVVYKAARDQSVEHAPMVIFGVAAAVLALFMLRT